MRNAEARVTLGSPQRYSTEPAAQDYLNHQQELGRETPGFLPS